MIKPILFFSYARSGGSVLNKCLLNLPNTIVLSEINPVEFGEGLWKKRPTLDEVVQLQLKEWYDIDLNTITFDESILKLIAYCTDKQIRLIIRDFSIADFVSSPLHNNQPKNQFSWIQWMNKHQIDYQSFSMIRYPMDVWISQKMPDLNQFTFAYACFLKKLKTHQIPYIYFELFTKNPTKELQYLMQLLKINHEIDSLLDIKHKNKLFGDLKKGKNSTKQQRIIQLKPKPIPYWKWKRAYNKFKDEATFTSIFKFDSPDEFKLILNTIRYYCTLLKKRLNHFKIVRSHSRM